MEMGREVERLNGCSSEMQVMDVPVEDESKKRQANTGTNLCEFLVAVSRL